MNEQLGRSACSTKSASVVIADDDGHVRTALLQLLEEEPGLTVLGTARDADEALILITEHQPDVIVVDVNMPAGGGPRVAAETRASHRPRASSPCLLAAIAPHVGR